MNATIQQILAENGTKTAKIQKLILLGLTRKQIAGLVTNGNYGFVQNVYAKMREQGLLQNMVSRALNTTFNRKFGIEIEAYNITYTTLKNALTAAGINCQSEGYNHATRGYWKIVSDASLQGNNTFELVSPPLQGEAGIEELKTVCRVLKECNAKINKSCGTHIHFDAANFNLQTWKNLFKNYKRLENVIDNFMPNSRRANNNTYCKSLDSFRNFDQQIDSSTSIQNIADFFGSRYYKLNPQSYSRHKTIEFRQHSGTIEFAKISNWIYFLNNLVNKSVEGLIENTTLEGLRDFNNNDLVEFFTRRTNNLM